LGVDPLPEDVDTLDFVGLSRALRHAMTDRNMTDRNQLSPSTNAEPAGSPVASRADDPAAVAASGSAGASAKVGRTEVAATAAADDQRPGQVPTAQPTDLH
jgi:hypothetical protein